MLDLTQTVEQLLANVKVVKQDNISLATGMITVQDSNDTYGARFLDMTH